MQRVAANSEAAGVNPARISAADETKIAVVGVYGYMRCGASMSALGYSSAGRRGGSRVSLHCV